jgi:predicted cation transporter
MVAAVVLPADKVFVFIAALAVIGDRVNLVDISAVKVRGVVSEEFEVGWGHIAR